MVFKLLIVLIIVFVIFGAGKLPQVMGDLGKGIKALKDGMQEDKKPETPIELAKESEKDKTL